MLGETGKSKYSHTRRDQGSEVGGRIGLSFELEVLVQQRLLQDATAQQTKRPCSQSHPF